MAHSPSSSDLSTTSNAEGTPSNEFMSTPSNVEGSSTQLFIRPYEESYQERLLGIVESQLELINRLNGELALKDRLLMQKDSEMKLLTDKQAVSPEARPLWKRLMKAFAGDSWL